MRHSSWAAQSRLSVESLIMQCAAVFLALLAVAAATSIKQCSTVLKKVSNDDVDITACKRVPCPLKQNTQTAITMKLKPDRDIKTLKNTVFGRILGLPLPFIGTDNTDACPQIYTVDGEKAGCPLKKGQEYVYKNNINILPIYPLVNVEVHWGLTMENGKDLSCFEIPAKIIK